jgi:hypothetical protein
MAVWTSLASSPAGALSSLARYHPERWTRALNRDRSVTAIPIEETLDVGREILPWLRLWQLSPQD